MTGRMRGLHVASAVVMACLAIVLGACSPSGSTGDGGAATPDEGAATGKGGATENVIRITGSDTMVNLAQAWAETYHESRPDVSIQVAGGGSGVGIASLSQGIVDIANSSRKIKEKEAARAKSTTGKEPKEIIVGLDALALYVHKDNPLDSISIEELAEIYGEDGKITKWAELGIDNSKCGDGEIIRVSRQNNSGTYAYFREAVLGEGREFKLGSIDQSGSKDAVALVSHTPCSIGYSGMGYRTDEVKVLRISAKKGEEGIEPSVESASSGTYPISRPLYMYTLGEPTGVLKEFIDWVLSPEGQKIILDVGYVPLESGGAN